MYRAEQRLVINAERSSHMESKFAALKEKVLQVQVIQIEQIRRLILAFSNAFSPKQWRTLSGEL